MSSVSTWKAKYVSELKRLVKSSSGNGSRDVAVLGLPRLNPAIWYLPVNTTVMCGGCALIRSEVFCDYYIQGCRKQFSVVRPTSCRVVYIENSGWWVVINACYLREAQSAYVACTNVRSQLAEGLGTCPIGNFEKQNLRDWNEGIQSHSHACYISYTTNWML